MSRIECVLLTALLVLAGAVPAVQSQDFQLSWFTIDGGGATWSAGSNFEISGTIGQFDAGVIMFGGSFQIEGGLWAGILPYTAGDLNCDGVVDLFDIDPFVMALTEPELYDIVVPRCDPALADTNADGEVNLFDIDPFVALLTGP